MPTIYVLLALSCTRFLITLVLTWAEKSPLLLIFVPYGAVLTAAACMSTLFLEVPKSDALITLGIFALLSLPSDNIAHWLGP